MKKKVARLAKGFVDQTQPHIEITPAEVRDTVTCGQIYRGSFRLESRNRLSFRGVWYADDERIEIADSQFGGLETEVIYIVHSERLREPAELSGAFSFVTTGGEFTVPYRFSVRQAVLAREEMPADRGELLALYQKDPEALARCFDSPLFRNLAPVAGDARLRLLADGLRRSRSSRQGLDEFMTAAGLQKRVRLTVDETVHRYRLKAGEDRAEIVIRRDRPGFLSIQLATEGDFLRVPADSLSDADFIGDECRLPVLFSRRRLHAGKNLGAVILDAGFARYTVPLEVWPEAGDEQKEREEARNARAALLHFDRTVIRVFTSDRPAALAQELADAWDACTAFGEPNLSMKVLKAVLLARMERRAEERALLAELRVEAQRSRSREPSVYLWYLYLEALLGTSRDSVAGVGRLLARFREEGLDDPMSFLLGLRMDELEQPSPAEAIRKIRAFEAEGLMDPMLKLEACHIYNEHPELLREGDAFERRILLFGARFGAWTQEMARTAAHWVENREGWHPSYYRILAGLYASYPDRRILEAILRLLIGSEKLRPEYHHWYAEGLDEDIRLTRLYEYYLCTLPKEQEKPLPKFVLLYFSYNSPELPEARRALYANILRFFPPESHVYRLYEKQMQSYALEQLLAGEAGEEMAGLYERMFIPEVLEEKTAGLLYDMLYMQQYRFEGSDIRRVAVLYPELKAEELYPVENGRAMVPCYTKDCRVLFEDARGLRWSRVREKHAPLMRQTEALADACVRYCPDKEGVRLREVRRLSEKQVGPQDYPALGRCLGWDRLESGCRNALLQKAVAVMESGDPSATVLLRRCMTDERDETAAGVLFSGAVRLDDRESALKMLRACDLRRVDPELLGTFVTRSIRTMHYEYEERIFTAALYLYRQGWDNAVTLTELCRFFNGSSEEMRAVLRRCSERRGLVYDMPERLLGQMLFSGDTKDLEWVCRLYLENTERPDKLLQDAYEIVQSDRYFRGEIALTARDVDYLKTWALTERKPENLPLVGQMALTSVFSEQSELNEQEHALAQAMVDCLCRQGLRFAYQLKLGRFIQLPAELADRTLIEYRGSEEGGVQIDLRILPEQEDEEPVRTEMPQIYRGVYVRSLLLFAGERAEYEIFTGEGETRRTLAEGTAVPDRQPAAHRNRFRKLNELIAEAGGFDDPAWQEKVLAYGREDVILKNYFDLL